jgi:hypothetical protein
MSQRGKLLNNEMQITEFSGEGINAPFNKTHVALRFSPYLGYSLNDRAGVYLRPVMNWQRNDVFDRSQWHLDNIYIDLTVGLRYRF